MTEHPICPRCSQPVFVGAYVCAERGQLYHLRCVRAKTNDRAQELIRQSRAIAARTAEFVRQRQKAS
jgi:hypothetical protein